MPDCEAIATCAPPTCGHYETPHFHDVPEEQSAPEPLVFCTPQPRPRMVRSRDSRARAMTSLQADVEAEGVLLTARNKELTGMIQTITQEQLVAAQAEGRDQSQQDQLALAENGLASSRKYKGLWEQGMLQKAHDQDVIRELHERMQLMVRDYTHLGQVVDAEDSALREALRDVRTEQREHAALWNCCPATQ